MSILFEGCSCWEGVRLTWFIVTMKILILVNTNIISVLTLWDCVALKFFSYLWVSEMVSCSSRVWTCSSWWCALDPARAAAPCAACCPRAARATCHPRPRCPSLIAAAPEPSSSQTSALPVNGSIKPASKMSAGPEEECGSTWRNGFSGCTKYVDRINVPTVAAVNSTLTTAPRRLKVEPESSDAGAKWREGARQTRTVRCEVSTRLWSNWEFAQFFFSFL